MSTLHSVSFMHSILSLAVPEYVDRGPPILLPRFVAIVCAKTGRILVMKES